MMLPIELTKVLYEDWQGQLQTSSSEGQLYGKCLSGPGKIKFKNGNQYKGQFLDGMLHGHGRFEWANGIVYEGEFKHNRLEGQGIYRWTDGSSYEGEVKDGLRHGHGKLTLQDCVYEGQWIEGNRHGKGKISFNNGGIYQGDFVNGLKHGHGRMYYPSGNFYEGSWKEDKKHGQGVMHWTDSRQKYSGQWAHNQQHGWGVHLWLDSRGEGKFMRNRYQGEWKNGLREGFGTFYYANGSKYQGTWFKNMKDGYAFFTDELGRVSQTFFKNDRIVKESKKDEEKPENKTQRKSEAKLEKKDDKKPADKRKSTAAANVSNTDSVLSNRVQTEISNPYAIMLHVDSFFIPQRPDLEQLYNCLLRNNSQLKNWYRGLSTFYDNHSQYSFSLILENVWKMVRSLKILGKISLAQIDRACWGFKANVRNMLEISGNRQKKVELQDMYYFDQSFNTVPDADWNKFAEIQNQRAFDVNPMEALNVHDPQRIILLRDLVQILVYVAITLEPNHHQPQKSVQKLLAKIGPSMEALSRGEKRASEQSQNLSSVSKTQKSAPQYAKVPNSRLFKVITDRIHEQHRRDNEDRTVKIKDLIQIFKISNIFVETDCQLLEKLLQKHLDSEYLVNAQGGSEKLTAKLLLLSDYELIQFEFIDFLFYYLVKKLPSSKDTEDNRNKYEQFIKKLESAAKIVEHNKSNQRKANDAIRITISAKKQAKKTLQENRAVMEKIRAKREALRLQRQNESREMRVMQLNDINIVEETFDEQDHDSEY